jgi:osmotically-inducible protein OsmY
MVQKPLPTEDAQIAREIVDAIRRDQPEICDRVHVEVDRGHVSLSGNVVWRHQRSRAEATARLVPGVASVGNALIVTPGADGTDIKKLIEGAFTRSAELDANQINVQVDRGNVVLSGRVRTWTEWTEAQSVAESAPGVTQVQNEITVGN